MKGVSFRLVRKIYSYIHVPQTNFVYGITGNRYVVDRHGQFYRTLLALVCLYTAIASI